MRHFFALALLAWCPAQVVAGILPLPVVRVQQVDGWNRTRAVMPGTLSGYVVLQDGRTIYVLVEPAEYPDEPPPPPEEPADKAEEQEPAPPPCPEPADPSPPEPLALYRLEQQELILVREDIPADGSLLAADLNGDGEDELLIKRPGQILQLQPQGLTPLVSLPAGLTARLHEPVDGAPALASTISDAALRLYRASGGSAEWEETTAVELPKIGRVGAGALTVRHAVPRYIGDDRGGRLLYATKPQAVGPRRLQVTLVALDRSTGEAQVSDCWAGLPGPEMVLHYDFLLLDGRPMLLAQTMPSDKLSLFGEKLLRLFPLETDRSRLGISPLFAVQSRMNLWQDSHPVLLDVNRDGRMDLVMGYWKGLMSPRVALDVYLREPDGSLRSSPRTTAFDVKDGEGSYLHYGDDLDGDSLPDLLVRSDEGWLLHPGLPSSSGKKLVDRRATALPLEIEETVTTQVEMQMSTEGMSHFTSVAQGAPQFADLAAAEGRAIVLVWPGDDASPGALQILWRNGALRGPSS